MHGTPEQVAERLEELVAAGANHLLLNPVSRHVEQLEAVAELARAESRITRRGFRDYRRNEKALRDRCLELAADFATRSAGHDRDASHPSENYDRLRKDGFLHLTIPRGMGRRSGFNFLGHTIAYEALGRGCPSTALAFNMHASVVMPSSKAKKSRPIRTAHPPISWFTRGR